MSEEKLTIKSLKKEMDDFKDEVKNGNNKILDILEKIINKDDVGMATPKVAEVVEIKSGVVELTPEQNAVFEKYFDKDDGFSATYNISDNVFAISVPIKLSNATQAYKDFYRKDLRSRKVDPNNVLGSIEQWCALVAQNLQYNRRIKLK